MVTSGLVSVAQEEVLGKAYDGRLMRRLLAYLRPYRSRTVLAVAVLIVTSFLDLVGPLATAVAVDLFIAPPESETSLAAASRWVRDHWGGPLPAAEVGVALAAGVFFVALLLGFFARFYQSYSVQVMGQNMMFDLRRELYRHLQRLPVSFFDKNPVGRLVTRATTDVEALNELFSAGLVSIFGDIALLGGTLVVLLWLDWRLSLATFVILPPLLVLTLWFKAKARYWYRQMRERVAQINAFLQEHLSGMSIVQLFNQEERVEAEFKAVASAHRDAHVHSIFYYAIYYPSVELITATGLGLIVWYGGGRVLSEAISLGALIAFLQYAQRFYEPLADLSEKYNILQGAMASSERIFKLLDEPISVVPPAAGYAPERARGAIELEHVVFSYNPGEPVLRDVSFRVAPGEMVAVVGHTGAGKSTLANLLLRFYDVDSGAVRVDGVDVREWDLHRLRRSIGMVLQDVFLFSGTVGQNIDLGADWIDRDRLRWAASEVRALDFIERMPGGFDALLRERGAGLSVGQKQLLSFARALAFDPRILILDEATSSIDTETEQLIQAALARLLVGRTSLVIAHRLSTIQKADRILVLHRGQLREQGTHQELLAQRGIYFKLYQLQYSEQGAA